MLPATFIIVIALLGFDNGNALEEAHWPLYYCLMFSWARNMIELQLDYVSGQKFNPFNIGTLSFVVPAIGYLFLDVPAANYFWVVVVITGVVFL